MKINPNWRRDYHNNMQMSLPTLGDFGANVLYGTAQSIEGIVDTIVGLTGMFGNEQYKQQVTEFVKNNYTQKYLIDNIDPHLQNSALKKAGVFGDVTAEVLQGVGGMLPMLAIGHGSGAIAEGLGATGKVVGAVTQIGSLGTLGASAMGSAEQQAYNEGANYWQGQGYGAVRGATEIATEKLFGGFTKGLTGKGIIDGAIKVAPTGARRILMNTAEEGLEEVASEVLDPLSKTIYKGKDALNEYGTPEFKKNVVKAGVVGGLTSLAFGGTVGYGMSKAGLGYSGKEADIADSIESIETATTKFNNEFDSDKLTDKRVEGYRKNLQGNYANIQKALMSASETKRAKMIEKFSLEKAFNSDGTMSDDLSNRLNSVAQNSTLASPQNRYKSTDLSAEDVNEGAKRLSTDEMQIEAYDGEMTDTQKENYKKFKTAFRKLNRLGNANFKFAVVKPNKLFNGVKWDGDKMFINAERFNDSGWTETLVHEETHFTEGSKEYSELREFVFSPQSDIQLDRFSRISDEVIRNYGKHYDFTEEDLKNIVAKAKEEGISSLTEKERKIYDVYSSEMVAHMTEDMLGNEAFIKRLVKYKPNLATKILNKIKDLLDSNIETKELRKAEELYLNAVESAGMTYKNRQIVKAQREEEEKAEETKSEESKNEEPNKSSVADFRFSLKDIDSDGDKLSTQQKEYFKNSKAVNENGELEVVYHGSTWDFNVFLKEKASPEGDMGAGFYFTNEISDAEGNYADVDTAPDLKTKIEILAENIESEEDLDSDDALEKAKSQLVGGESNIIESYLNIVNPVYPDTRMFEPESSIDYDDYEDEDAYYEALDEETETYYEKFDDIKSDLYDIVDLYDDGQLDRFISDIIIHAQDYSGITIAEMKEIARNYDFNDEDGNYINNEVIRGIIEVAGYDGIIDNEVSSKFKKMGLHSGVKHYIVFNSNQIKRTSNKTPTDSDDIRFSLKVGDKTIEADAIQDKDLVAVHNLSEEHYRQMLAMGGLPSPSIAVTKAKVGHESFGEISIIFNKNTIDPQTDTRNKVYDRDAYTPTFPKIEYRLVKTSKDKIRRKFDNLRKRSTKGGVNSGSSIIYAIEKNGIANMVNEAINLETLRDEFLLDKYDIQPLTKYVLNKNEFAEYKKWVHDVFESLDEEQGILVNESANTWEERHTNVTLNNILKAMNKVRNYGVDDGNMLTLGYIKSLYSETFNSIKEIKENSSKIKDNNEAIDKQTTPKLEAKMRGTIQVIKDSILNNIASYEKEGIAEDILIKIADNKARTTDEIQQILDHLFAFINFEDTNLLANNINEFIVDLENSVKNNTEFFEAKPQRIVYTDEWAMVLFGKDVKESTIKMTSEKNIPYSQVKENLTRKDILSEMDDLRFSLKSTDSEGNTLSEEQREFFKDSKVVNDKGELLVMYHGTFEDFTIFDITKTSSSNDLGKGHYFTTSKKDADKHYATNLEDNDIGQKVEELAYDLYYEMGFGEDDLYDNDSEAISAWNKAYDEAEKHFSKDNANILKLYINAINPLYIKSGKEYGRATSQLYLDKVGNIVDLNIEDANKLGYDAIIDTTVSKKFNGISDDTYHVVAFDSNQVKLTTNKTPTDSDDIRFSFKRNDGKDIKSTANKVREKTYTKEEAKMILDSILESDSFLVGQYEVSLKGKTKQQAIDTLWRELNKASDTDKVIEDMTNYIINNAVLEDVFRDDANEQYIATIDALRDYRHRLNLSKIREEIKSHYDKDNSVYARWSTKEKGMSLDDVKAELESKGIYLDAETNADILFEIDDMYHNAITEINKKVEKSINDFAEEDIEGMRSDIRYAITEGKSQLGTKTKVAKLIEKYQKTILNLKDKLVTQSALIRAEGNVLDSARKLEDMLNGKYVNASEVIDEGIKSAIKSITRVEVRGNVNKSGIRTIAENLGKWYNANNKIFESDGMIDLFDEGVAQILQEIAQKDKNEPLSVNEMKNLNKILSHMAHLLKAYKGVFKNGKMVDAIPYVQEMIERYQKDKANKKIRKVNTNSIAFKYWSTFGEPMAIAQMMDNYEQGIFTETLEEFRQGQMKADLMKIKMRKRLDAFFKKNKGYLKSAEKRTIKYNGENIPLQVALAWYMTSKRKQATKGLALAGFKYLNDKNEYIRLEGVLPNSFDEQAMAQAVAEERDKVYEQFNELDKEYIKISEEIFNKFSKDAKYDTDMALKGFSNILEDYYFPLRRTTPKEKLDTNGWRDEIQSVSNSSFNKDTIQGAGGELFIGKLSDITDRHIDGISMYYGLAIPLHNFDMLFNLNIGDKNKPTTINTETENIWKDGYKYFKNLFADIQKLPNGRGVSKFLNKLRSGYAMYQLGFNPKVLVTQLSSIMASLNILSVGDILQVARVRNNKGDLDKYTPLAEIRNYNNDSALAQGVLDKANKIGDFFMRPIGTMDRLVVDIIFKASQVRVERKMGYKIGTEENLTEAGKLTEKIILETQQSSLATERSAGMRSVSEFMKSFTMFSADAMKLSARVIGNIDRYRVLNQRYKSETDPTKKVELKKEIAEARKQVLKSTQAIASVSIFMALITQAFKWLYDKDDEEDKMLSLIIDSIGNLFGGLPIIRDVVNFFDNGFEVDTFATSTINDLLKSSKEFFDVIDKALQGDMTEQDVYKALKTILYSSGQLLGIPFRNMYNMFFGLTKRLSPNTALKIESKLYDKSFKSELKQAMEEGDIRRVETLAEIIVDNATDKDLTPSVRNEMERLVGKGYDNITPRKIGTSIRHDGEEIELNKTQRRQFKEIYSYSNKALASLVQSNAYKRANDEAKAKAIKMIYDTYYDFAKEEVLGLDTGNKNLIFANAIDIQKLAIAVATARQFESTKVKGLVVNGSKKARVSRYIQGLNLTAIEKELVFGYLGYSNNSKGEPRMRAYISRLNLSKQDKVKLMSMSGYPIR